MSTETQLPTPFDYGYFFSDPFGGSDVVRYSSSQWNGNSPKRSMALYTEQQVRDLLASQAAELAALKVENEALKADWAALQYAIVGNSGKSAILEVEALRKDAERYEKLFTHCRSTPEHWGGRWSIVVDGPAPKTQDSRTDFDAAIDAAMQTKEAS